MRRSTKATYLLHADTSEMGGRRFRAWGQAQGAGGTLFLALLRCVPCVTLPYGPDEVDSSLHWSYGLVALFPE